ncbi:MAG TPA: pitrilysin family protein [Thermoanaerobaculia bacterium]|nr:pitrilysin family protein [Thermoanaerobaculia bacterium]
MRFRCVLGVLAVLGVHSPLAAAPPAAVPIPDRPEQLRFADLTFEVPNADGLRHVLSNGVPVYVVEDHTLPLVDIVVAVRSGDWIDPPERAGRASFTAALVRRGGTASRPPDAFDEQVDFLGADIESLANVTRSGATLNVSSQSLGEGLGLFCEMIRAPRFDAGRVAVARDNLRESLGRRTDNPLEVLGREWGRLLYGADHPRVREVSPRHLESLTPAELTAFHRATWRPDTMVVAVSGDVATADVLARLETCFAGWPSPSGPPPAWPPQALAAGTPRPGLYYVERDIPQAKIILGHLGGQRRGWDDPDEPALEVMNRALGGRLLRKLRGELGLVYRVDSTFEVDLGVLGLFQVFLETENASAARAIQVAIAEVRRLREEPVSGPELDFARKALIDGFPLLFDTPAEIAGTFAEDEYLGRPHAYWPTYRDRIRRVTPEQVQRVAQRYLQPDKMVVVVVGKWADIASGAAAARIKPESLVRGPVMRLPERDPVTLEVRGSGTPPATKP